MNKIPQIESISTMKHQYNHVLNKLQTGPVVLTQHGQAVAILVDPTEWDRAVDEREELKDVVALLKAELEIERGEDELVVVDPKTFVAEMINEPVQA